MGLQRLLLLSLFRDSYHRICVSSPHSRIKAISFGRSQMTRVVKNSIKVLTRPTIKKVIQYMEDLTIFYFRVYRKLLALQTSSTCDRSLVKKKKRLKGSFYRSPLKWLQVYYITSLSSFICRRLLRDILHIVDLSKLFCLWKTPT